MTGNSMSLKSEGRGDPPYKDVLEDGDICYIQSISQLNQFSSVLPLLVGEAWALAV
jgi:hypothetical protein